MIQQNTGEEKLASSPAITRHPGNPILTSAQVPYPSRLVFNPGVTRYQGRYVMVFRNDYGWGVETLHCNDGLGVETLHCNDGLGVETLHCNVSTVDPHFDGTNLGLAYSADGVHWDVALCPCFDLGDDEIRRAYDPRLMVIDGRCYMCFAVDTHHGVRGGIAVTEDFERFEILSMSAPDNRNMVLFNERFGGHYLRLERPFPVYGRGGGERFDIWISDSPDLVYWGRSELLLGVEDVPYANTKLGPAAPPVKTDRGWLTTFHAVDTDPSRGKNGWEATWKKRYSAGIMLLDLEDPRRIVGLCRTPLIAPEAPYEVASGFRNHVVFPCGMILEPGGEVKIYYGAADTVICLVTADVDDLIALCT